MTIGIIGRKIGMTQTFTEKGELLPITLIKAGPCTIVQKKTVKTDNYNAIQLGFEDQKDSKLTKPLAGHYKKANIKPKKFLKEVRLDEKEIENYKEGDEITVSAFENCKFVDVIGTSKGRGFAGVIKRYSFHRPKTTHGTHDCHRHGGSLGCRFPQRVVKGKKMAGHMGNERVTTQNIKLVSIQKDENLILLNGTVPGPSNGIVFIKTALKRS